MSADNAEGPVNLDDPNIDLDSLPLSYWYTAADAAAALAKKSNRKVDPSYPRSLARAGGPIRTRKLGPRSVLYLRYDIDRYIVEPRGKKAGRAKKSRVEQRDSEGRE
jgi:hypothetical protein